MEDGDGDVLEPLASRLARALALVASAGALFLLFMLIVEGLPRPYETPIELMGFLLTFYTLPVVAFYLGGLVVGSTMRRVYRAFVRPSRPVRCGRSDEWPPRRGRPARRPTFEVSSLKFKGLRLGSCHAHAPASNRNLSCSFPEFVRRRSAGGAQQPPPAPAPSAGSAPGGGPAGPPQGGGRGRGGRGGGVAIQPGENTLRGSLSGPRTTAARPFPAPSIVDYRPRSTVVATAHPVPKAKYGAGVTTRTSPACSRRRSRSRRS